MFYTNINVCVVLQGNHSINAGRYYKKGTLLCAEYRTEELFPHVRTDGGRWYNSHTGEELEPVRDFRFAALYALAQLRGSLGIQKKFVKN